MKALCYMTESVKILLCKKYTKLHINIWSRSEIIQENSCRIGRGLCKDGHSRFPIITSLSVYEYSSQTGLGAINLGENSGNYGGIL